MDLSKYKDRLYLKWIKQRNLSGWQFAFERLSYHETKFFNVNKYGGADGAYKAALQYRNEFLEAAGELGVLHENARYVAPLVLKLSPRNTSGIVGVSRSYREREDRKSPEEYWVANFQNSEGKNKQRKYSIHQYGEKGALKLAIERRKQFEEEVLSRLPDTFSNQEIKQHIDELGTLLEWIDELEDDSEVFFFLGTINNPLLNSTQKQDMLNVRIGQRRFRKNVLDYWGHRCAVSNAKTFLNAGHIKPWKNSDDSERLDVFNGLALSPVYDRAFDVGLITFDAEGRIVVAELLKPDIENLAITGNEQISGLTFRHQKYLEYHRNEVYVGEHV
jgi:predicted restriction endonuclease